jgi:hypothetical protein
MLFGISRNREIGRAEFAYRKLTTGPRKRGLVARFKLQVTSQIIVVVDTDEIYAAVLE